MEVCQWCHEEIKKENKYIIGDPEKLFKSAMAGFSAGVNNHNRYQQHPHLDNQKYHLECYKLAKKKSNKNIIWVFLALIIISLIIIFVTLAVLGII